MRNRGFTLIEVMVVITIISIIAGIMAPAAWKFWESEETALTRQRMRDIKTAMVGNKNHLQNGIRTHFGFIGDNGELPFGNYSASGGLSYLTGKPADGYPHWNGPYLSGFAAEWKLDAWGKPFRYTPTLDAYGRYISAELRSAGPDGIFDNSDDIVDAELQITDRETTPTNRVQGNIYGAYSSAGILISFKDPKDPSGISSRTLCKKLAVMSGYSNYTTLFESSANQIKLPVGTIEVTATMHNHLNCTSSSVKNTHKLLYYISDGVNQISLPELR